MQQKNKKRKKIIREDKEIRSVAEIDQVCSEGLIGVHFSIREWGGGGVNGGGLGLSTHEVG